MNFFQAILLAIIEGITEFLPVSSTGHMIIGSSLMGIAPSEFTKIFIVAIQFGTILSVLVLYWKRFIQSIDFYLKLLVAFIPAAIMGKLFGDLVDSLLENVLVVGIMLMLGGIVFLFVDKWFENSKSKESDSVNFKKAFIIGIYQCIALIPGVSRSAATIIGGLSQKLNRESAAEFSFFLAVPTMFAATAYKILKYYQAGNSFTSEEINLLLVGNLIGFLVAIIAIKTFISILQKHGFKAFGYYRIILGLLIIVLYALGVPLVI